MFFTKIRPVFGFQDQELGPGALVRSRSRSLPPMMDPMTPPTHHPLNNTKAEAWSASFPYVGRNGVLTQAKAIVWAACGFDWRAWMTAWESEVRSENDSEEEETYLEGEASDEQRRHGHV